ncbi:MAG: Uma2 family endonuclease [Desulfobulbaceae bacterium]|nr:Uma2 family endonuclease [Desulfobulbaceae bacterium]
MSDLLTTEDLPRYTYKDYLNWEDRWELIQGVPYAMSPAPSPEHQRISNKIARYLDEALENCEKCTALLPVDWKIDEQTIVQPDNLVVCFQIKGHYITKTPSIIFEILSPSTSLKDQNLKYRLYEHEGVRYYCLVYTDEKIIKIFTLQNGRYIKHLDATDETVSFELQECSFDLDFSKIWNL